MPKLLKTPFAIDAAEGFRTDIQESTGAAPNSATYQVGFPPVTMQSIASNGMPPKGSDLNGVLYDITDNLVFLTQGGGYGFDSAYATSIGGYPLNARLRLTNGDIVKSTIDGNTNDPNVDMAGWVYSNLFEPVINLDQATKKQLNVALAKDDGFFYYDESKSLENNFGTIINGWVRITGAVLTPRMFGAKGDGATNDKLAIQRMLAMVSAGFRAFDFEGLEYYCGEVQSSVEPFFKLDTVHGLRILNCRIRVANESSAVTDAERSLFKFIDCSDLKVDVTFTGGERSNIDDYNYALHAVVLQAKTIDSNTFYVNVNASHCKSAFQVENAIGLTALRPVGYAEISRGFVNINVSDSLYGFRVVNNGRDITAHVNSKRVRRSFFVVGTSDIQGFVNSRYQVAVADVLIKAYRNNVDNIYVSLNTDSPGVLEPSENVFVIEHQNDTQDTSITNVTLDVRVRNRGTPKSWGRAFGVVGRQYPAATSVIEPTTTSITDNIKVNISYESGTNLDTIEFPTRTTSPALVELSGCSYTRETNNFTVKIGNRYICSTAKNPKDNNLYIYLKNIRPSGVFGELSILGVDDYRQISLINSSFKKSLVRIANPSSGVGDLVEIGTPVEVIDGTAWGFSALLRLGCIQVATNKDLTSAYTKFVAVFEPSVGTNFL